MTLAQRVEGLFVNYLRGEDEGKWGSEEDVVTKAVVEPLLRFDASYSQPTGGQPRDEYEAALDTWNKMDLGHIFGFPLWEPEVFELLKANFGELKAIFASYAMSGGSSGGAFSAMTMDQTELTQFAVDCALETGEFPITRIIAIFERADIVDDAKDGKSKSGQKVRLAEPLVPPRPLLTCVRARLSNPGGGGRRRARAARVLRGARDARLPPRAAQV